MKKLIPILIFTFLTSLSNGQAKTDGPDSYQPFLDTNKMWIESFDYNGLGVAQFVEDYGYKHFVTLKKVNDSVFRVFKQRLHYYEYLDSYWQDPANAYVESNNIGSNIGTDSYLIEDTTLGIVYLADNIEMNEKEELYNFKFLEDSIYKNPEVFHPPNLNSTFFKTVEQEFYDGSTYKNYLIDIDISFEQCEPLIYDSNQYYYHYQSRMGGSASLIKPFYFNHYKKDPDYFKTYCRLCYFENDAVLWGDQVYCHNQVTRLRTTGINENVISQAQINVYPNPNNGQFKIAGLGLGQNSVQIIDLNGKVVHQEVVLGGKDLNINQQELKNGIYIIVIENENLLVRERVTINR